MSRSKSKSTDGQRDWAAALQVALTESDRPPAGEGWKTIAEIAALRGVTTQTVGSQVARAYRDGKLERFLGRAGSCRTPTYYYRPVATIG